MLAECPVTASGDDAPGERLAPLFRPPAELANDLGVYRSPLRFRDGGLVRTAGD
jgi:hypothetical protein